MEFFDLIRREMFEGFASKTITGSAILVCIISAALLGTYIFIVYRRLHDGSFYNRNFNLSLIAIAVITAAIILTIQSNIVVSLGMVGALSIVRFRTAVKDPLDLVFLFWAISVGIICGAGFGLIAVIASLVLTVIMIVVLNLKAGRSATLLVVHTNGYDCESNVMDIVNANCANSRMRAQNADKAGMDMTIEVRVREREKLLRELMESDCVRSVSFVENTENEW